MSNLIGQSLGRYRILDELGKGGMAVVYKAYDTRLERDVAIKFIRRGAFPPDQLDHILKRFEREAKALARLSHPNIVRVLDYGEHENSPYLVMEHLPGGTLKHHLGKPIPWQDAVRLLIPIAQALEYAHEHDVIHRDIKPSNILLAEKGQPMLTDFGIAKVLEVKETTSLTSTGIGLGTPEYMAPEQWKGQTTSQSDIYSLGVVFYETVTGRKPYEADTPAEILLKQAYEPLPRPKSYVRNLPDEVEKIILKALAKKPNDRYRDMSAMIAALERLLTGKILNQAVQVQSDETVDEWGTQTKVEPFEQTPSGASVAPAKSNTLIGAGIWLAVVLCMVLGGYFVYAASIKLDETPTSLVETNTSNSTNTLHPTLLGPNTIDSLPTLSLPFAPTYTPYPISPQLSQANGEIAFVSDRSGKTEIYIMNADGSDQTRLAEGSYPTWSPDGRKIAYIVDPDTEPQIYVMNADGSDQTHLTRGYLPVWSPDSRKLAFIFWVNLVKAEVHTINADGSGETMLADGVVPKWSPDGRRIAFTFFDETSYCGVCIINADGSGQTWLVADGNEPTWSPDGTRIAYTRVQNGTLGVYVINIDGSGLAYLGNTQTVGNGMVWSPRGERIVFTGIREGELMVANADGSDQTRLVSDGYSPTWSPDGAWIAFISSRDGNTEVYVINADGSEQMRLTNNGDNDALPIWRP